MDGFQSWTEVTTVGDLLVRAAARHRDRAAIIFPEWKMTYGALLDGALTVAKGLAGLGVPTGAHVGLLCNNSQELVTGFFGALLAGCVAVPLNARHKARELGYIIKNADLTAILTTAADTTHVDFRASLLSGLPSLAAATNADSLTLLEAPCLKRLVLLAGDAPQGFMDRAAFERAGANIDDATIDSRRRQARIRDVAVIIYTSGTTANPKGCMLTHESMTRGAVERARHRFSSGDHDVTWGGGPLFHIGSLAPFLGSIGACGTYLTDVVFEPARAIALMTREGVTAMWPWFPAILQPILDHPTFNAAQFSTLRAMLLIGPETLVMRVQALFPQAEIMQACGMTETSGIFALSGADETAQSRATSQGKAVPGISVRVVDIETGAEAAPGKAGEILVRGYCVMEGYYHDPEKTAAALRDGWLHTGDLYTRDANGQLTFNGRVKDMLKVGGENVAAIEVEAFLCSHPAVKLAEVVGRPDARLDEVPVAFIELRPGQTVTEDELIAFCKGRIASYKVPRAIYHMANHEWPMSATKVDKRALRERLTALSVAKAS